MEERIRRLNVYLDGAMELADSLAMRASGMGNRSTEGIELRTESGTIRWLVRDVRQLLNGELERE